MINYEATGHIRLAGCAGLGLYKNYTILFLVGSRVYVKRKARLGVMEPVVLKRINRVALESASYRGVQPEINYVDTFNRVWMENELLSEENAVDLARKYWGNIEQIGRRMFEEDGCFPIKPEGCR
jgi:hypothetical protein